MTVTRRLRRRRDHVAARHVPAPSEDAFKSAAACGAVLVVGPGGGTRFGMGGGRSRCGPLSPSRPSRTCVLCHGRATRDPVGPSVAGRPRRGGPPAVVSELHSSGESGYAGRCRPRGSSDLRDQPEPAGPSGHGRRARDGEVCRGRNSRLAECARFSPAWAMLVAPVVSTTLGGLLAASRANR